MQAPLLDLSSLYPSIRKDLLDFSKPLNKSFTIVNVIFNDTQDKSKERNYIINGKSFDFKISSLWVYCYLVNPDNKIHESRYFCGLSGLSISQPLAEYVQKEYVCNKLILETLSILLKIKESKKFNTFTVTFTENDEHLSFQIGNDHEKSIEGKIIDIDFSTFEFVLDILGMSSKIVAEEEKKLTFEVYIYQKYEPLIKEDSFRSILYKLYQKQEGTDFELISREGTKFKIHKLLLLARQNTFFTSMLSNFKEGQNSKINFPEVEAKVLNLFVTYLYLGKDPFYLQNISLKGNLLCSLLDFGNYIAETDLFNICCVLLRRNDPQLYSILETYIESQNGNTFFTEILNDKPVTEEDYHLSIFVKFRNSMFEPTFWDKIKFVSAKTRVICENMRDFDQWVFKTICKFDNERHFVEFLQTGDTDSIIVSTQNRTILTKIQKQFVIPGPKV